MSTRCVIGKKTKDGYEAIYSHWDGYPEKPGVGWMLRKYYKNPAKINKLISLGSISSLGKEIGRKHSFNKPHEGWTVAYHRDRGEPWKDTKPQKFKTLQALKDFKDAGWTEYLYVYEKGKWHTYR